MQIFRFCPNPAVRWSLNVGFQKARTLSSISSDWTINLVRDAPNCCVQGQIVNISGFVGQWHLCHTCSFVFYFVLTLSKYLKKKHSELEDHNKHWPGLKFGDSWPVVVLQSMEKEMRSLLNRITCLGLPKEPVEEPEWKTKSPFPSLMHCDFLKPISYTFVWIMNMIRFSCLWFIKDEG